VIAKSGFFLCSSSKRIVDVLGVRFDHLPSCAIIANGIDDVRYIEMFDEHGR
jgi:hypothetical protein